MTGFVLRLNPLVLLAIGLAALIGSFAVRSMLIALVTLGVWTALVLLTVPRLVFASVCLAFSGFAGLTVMYSTWRLGGHDLGLATTAGLRIVILAWPGSVAAGFIEPARLADHLAQSLRFPGRPVAALSAAMQRYADFAQTWTELVRVRRARGLGPERFGLAWFKHGAGLAFALVVHALRDASRTAIAMDARGFATAEARSWAEPAVWTRADGFGLFAALLLAALPWVLSTG